MEYYIIKRDRSKNTIDIIATCQKKENLYFDFKNTNSCLKGNKKSNLNNFIKNHVLKNLSNDNFNILEKNNNEGNIFECPQFCEIFNNSSIEIPFISKNFNTNNHKHYYTTFFIEDDEYLYGPFVQNNETNIIDSNLKLLDLKYKYFILKIKKNEIINLIINEKNKKYIDLYLLRDFLKSENLIFDGNDSEALYFLSNIDSISSDIINIKNKLIFQDIYKKNKKKFDSSLNKHLKVNIFSNKEDDLIYNMLRKQFKEHEEEEINKIENLKIEQEKINQDKENLQIELTNKQNLLNKIKEELEIFENKLSDIKEKIKNGYIFEKNITEKIINDFKISNFNSNTENNNIPKNKFINNVKNFNSMPIDEKLGYGFLIYLIKKFQKNYRYVSEIELLSFLVLSQQSFLTILAGLPGSGKTSFTNIFIEASHLRDISKEIPVSKGWNSQKDLIGFSNPITEKYSPDMNGLYYHLKELSDSEYTKSMSYILLDEANLSPLEHYFSIFMGKFDNEEKKEINLGKEKIYVDQNVKFIGTINYDSTTEPLSPRIIDRCPIIILENLKEPENKEYTSDIIAITELIEHNPDLVFNFNTMNILFNNYFRKSYTKFETIDIDLDYIIYIFENESPDGTKNNFGIEINISERKKKKIKSYFNKMMEYNNIINIVNYDEKVSDLAIYYFILPIISGNGESYEKRLNLLQKYLKEKKYERSFKCLDNILKHGKEYKNFSFFYW